MVYDRVKLEQIAHKLRIEIKDYDLLAQALTHRSFLSDRPGTESNERLEFLGDSVLGMVVAEHLHAEFPNYTEGELSKAKAVAVSEKILAESAKELGLPDMIFLSTGEDSSGGRMRRSILADVFEALVAAVYIDGGLDVVKQFVLDALQSILLDIERQEHIRDYKTLLQEHTQALCKKAPRYVVIDERGVDHDKTFVIEARLEDAVLGCGEGKSKKQAEQAAAMKALEYYRKDHHGLEGAANDSTEG